MKKIYAFFVALILFIIFGIIYNNILNKKIEKYYDSLFTTISDKKFNCIEAAKTCLNQKEEESILVLGSSELSSFKNSKRNYNNTKFNMYLVGRGYTQCLQSTLSLGAIHEECDINKVVLILSPQWFYGEDLSAESFSSRFQKGTFDEFMKNKKISTQSKEKIIKELKILESKDPMEEKKIEEYKNAYINKNTIDKIYLSIYSNIKNTFYKKELIKKLEEYSEDGVVSIADELGDISNNEFEYLLEFADNKGKSECTNNEFGIYDDYYNTYIKEEFESKKDILKGLTFSKNQEYRHLEMFLSTCEQLDICPLIVNVPVNGLWYDYVGVSKESRDEYYKKIQTIVNSHDAKLADFSNYEYEKYFLRDIMHLGWKGWVRVDEAIYQYYHEN